MRNRFYALLLSPVLLLAGCAQVSFTQKRQLEVEQKLLEYSQPSIVRVATACFGEYSKSSKSNAKSNESEKVAKDWVRSNYPKDDALPQGAGYFLGTGFFVSQNGFLITTKSLGSFADEFPTKKKCREHLAENVLSREAKDFDEKSRKELANGLSSGGRIELSTGIALELKDEDVIYWRHIIFQNGKPIAFEYRQGSVQNGMNIALIKVNVTNAPALHLATTEQTQIQDKVWILGYPLTSNLFDSDQRDKEIQQTDLEFTRNLLKEPQLPQAGVNVLDRSVSSSERKLPGSNAPLAQIDGRADESFFGSPVLNSKGNVVGVVTSVISSQTYAVPARTVPEVVTGFTNEQGDTYAKYRDGLDAYWKGDHQSADKFFRDVRALFKDHSAVDAKLEENQRASANASNNFLPWISLVVVGLGIPTVAFLLLRRRSVSRASVPSANPVDREIGRSFVETDRENGHSIPMSSRPFIQINYRDQMIQFDLEGSTYRVGRDRTWSDCELPEEGWERMGRRQLFLQREGIDYRIFDGDGEMPSSNGTYVNGSKITSQGSMMRHGAQVRIGPNKENPIWLTYFNPTARPAPAPTEVIQD